MYFRAIAFGDVREVEERLLCRGHEQWNWFVDEGSWWAKGDKALLQGLLWRIS